MKFYAWCCPLCGGLEAIATSESDWPEARAHAEAVAKAQHNERACAYRRALKVAAA